MINYLSHHHTQLFLHTKARNYMNQNIPSRKLCFVALSLPFLHPAHLIRPCWDSNFIMGKWTNMDKYDKETF